MTGRPRPAGGFPTYFVIGLSCRRPLVVTPVDDAAATTHDLLIPERRGLVHIGYLLSVLVLTVVVAAGTPAHTELPGARHSFDYFDSLRGRLAVAQIEACTAWVRSRRPMRVACGGSHGPHPVDGRASRASRSPVGH